MLSMTSEPACLGLTKAIHLEHRHSSMTVHFIGASDCIKTFTNLPHRQMAFAFFGGTLGLTWQSGCGHLHKTLT